jgi:hypothetical protein
MGPTIGCGVLSHGYGGFIKRITIKAEMTIESVKLRCSQMAVYGGAFHIHNRSNDRRLRYVIRRPGQKAGSGGGKGIMQQGSIASRDRSGSRAEAPADESQRRHVIVVNHKPDGRTYKCGATNDD